MHIDHVKYYVEDLERVRGFYVDKLGFQVNESTPEYTMVKRGGVTIDLMSPEDITQPRKANAPLGEGRWGHTPGHVHTAFKVSNVREAYQELVAKGVEFHIEPFYNETSGRTIAFFRDPEGNVLHLTD